MTQSSSPSSDVAFSPAVKAIQAQRGSRPAYARQEKSGGFETGVNGDLRDFLEQIDTAFLATASKDGQPYVQHRGGPRGFIRAVDERTLGFIDFAGNKQYVSTGNLSENDRVCLFLIDYSARRRVKVWGRARIVPANQALLKMLMPEGYRARPEQVLLLTVEAWDVNCPQHIPQKLDAAEVAEVVDKLRDRVAELEAENLRLRGSRDSEIDPALSARITS
jgi:predicted pyridoxine 5'-phosphate oxidase superfamily flavin-nucleotide-binding protein